MPDLWARIETRQRYSNFFGRLARGFVTAAVAASLMMAVYLSMPRHTSAFYSESYVESLASASHTEVPDQEAFRLDSLPTE